MDSASVIPSTVPANAPIFPDVLSATSSLECLSKSEIMLAGQPTPFGRQDKRSRDHLIETVVSLDPEIQRRIQEAAEGSPKRRRLNPTLPLLPGVDPAPAGHTESEFMKVQSPAVVQRCISNFIDRTSNAALRMATCIVCARDLEWESTTDIFIKDLPHSHLLVPETLHADHILIHGLLLHNQAVHDPKESSAKGRVCEDCRDSLKKDKLPKLSLANGMWIGDTPFELSVLTLVEQILIARNYPAAYIVKLYPKK